MNTNLVPAIRAIKTQIKELKSKQEKEMQPLIDGLQAIRKINTACEECAGIGTVHRRSCAEDEGENIKCPKCRGTGKVLNNEP